jgi:hypothetical protein
VQRRERSSRQAVTVTVPSQRQRLSAIAPAFAGCLSRRLSLLLARLPRDTAPSTEPGVVKMGKGASPDRSASGCVRVQSPHQSPHSAALDVGRRSGQAGFSSLLGCFCAPGGESARGCPGCQGKEPGVSATRFHPFRRLCCSSERAQRHHSLIGAPQPTLQLSTPANLAKTFARLAPRISCGADYQPGDTSTSTMTEEAARAADTTKQNDQTTHPWCQVFPGPTRSHTHSSR